MSIKSKIFEYGNEKESSWPPRFPDENTKRGNYYFDKESGTMKEGYPPDPNPVFDRSAMVIFDSMPATYHQAAGQLVESRSEWERLDREMGTLTFGSIEEPRRYVDKGKAKTKEELREDRRKAALEAIHKVRANPKEVRAKLQKVGERQRETAKRAGLLRKLKKEGIDI